MTGRVATELLHGERAAVPVARRAYTLPSASAAVAGAGSAAAIDEAARARLQALGYVGSRPSSMALQNLGESLYRAGKLDAAERALRSAVEAQPQNLAAWLWLARALQSRRDATAEAVRPGARRCGCRRARRRRCSRPWRRPPPPGAGVRGGRGLVDRAPKAGPPAVAHDRAARVLAAAGQRKAEAPSASCAWP